MLDRGYADFRELRTREVRRMRQNALGDGLGLHSFRVFSLSKLIRESRRADSNRLPLLITSELFY